MGRRKKTTEAELENTQTTLSIEDSNRAESEEAELIAEQDSEASLDGTEVETKKPRSRKTKKEIAEIDEVTEAVEAAEASTENSSEETEQVEISVSSDIEPIKESAPKRKPRKSRAKKTEVEIPSVTLETNTEVITETIAASAPISQSSQIDETLKQWTAIKQLSESVAQLLEKTSHLNTSNDCEIEPELLRPSHSHQNIFIAKFATAASIVAILLSLVSLSLSQSARHAVLGVMDPIQRSTFSGHSNSSLSYSDSKRVTRTNQSEESLSDKNWTRKRK